VCRLYSFVRCAYTGYPVLLSSSSGALGIRPGSSSTLNDDDPEDATAETFIWLYRSARDGRWVVSKSQPSGCESPALLRSRGVLQQDPSAVQSWSKTDILAPCPEGLRLKAEPSSAENQLLDYACTFVRSSRKINGWPLYVAASVSFPSAVARGGDERRRRSREKARRRHKRP
jgi:hypothetical protein